MSSRGSYPLEAARVLRAEEEDAALRALAQATSAHDEAQRGRVRLEEAQRAHRGETERVASDERQRDQAGRSVAEMVRAREWLAHREREVRELARRTDDARQRERDARAAMELARSALASARAEREAVEKHHASWLDEQRRTREKREEDEADDRSRRRS
jgi:hypothetical protein